jgi:putative toxin-antitoxin system antitoxin component (TIGR02293 family)
MHLSRISQLLGGKKTLGQEVRTPMDLISLSARGVPKESLVRLAEYMALSVSQMADLLPITERTVQRYPPHRHFSTVVSEHILQIAEVVARGADVFEDKENFLTWLNHPSTALGGRSPKSLLASRFGTEMVLDELTRIEHGIVA